MNMIIDYWALVIAILCICACVVTNIIYFYLEPRDKKIANLQEWLLYAVVEAEKTLGSGTGALKLRYVYNLAVDRFRWLPRVLTFDAFSNYVDDALEWMRVQLESNKAIKDYVNESSNNN